MSTGKGGGSVKAPKPEEYIGLVNAQAKANRLNKSTPFGKLVYKNAGEKPMTFKQWSKRNPQTEDQVMNQRGEYTTSIKRDMRGEYDKYLKNNPREKTAKFKFSPEVKGLFERQFEGDSYDNYADEYVNRFNELQQPQRDYNQDRFEQSMANRGIPEGSDVYGDVFRTTIGDPVAREDLMATQMAQGIGDNRKMQDWQRLMQAMGSTGFGVPGVDVMGAGNMAANANFHNANLSAQRQSDMFNTMAQMGAAAMMSGCSRDLKHNKYPVTTLDQLRGIPIERWTYNEGIGDEGDHISPYAEDFKEAFGVGDGKTIAFIDMMGVLLRSVQELAAEVQDLKCKQ